MNVNVSAETERVLKELAARDGKDVADFAGELLETQIRERQGNGARPEAEDPEALARAVARLKGRTPEEAAEARARIFERSRPPRPLPDGQTLLEAISGKWPGEETDEEVREALQRLS